jgi:alpha-tubulin suppressor-like RCC1 family protein
VWYKDADGDGYTDGTTEVSCKQPTGYVSQTPTGDCNDNDPNMNPGKIEICDRKDNNCNGQIDEEDVCVFVSAKVVAGGSHTCAIKTNSSLWCWGANGDGELVDGTNTAKNTPVQIMSSGVSSVELGQDYTCAVKTNGSL